MSEETQDSPMSDAAWLALVREGRDEGWKRIWKRVVEPESRSLSSSSSKVTFFSLVTFSLFTAV